MYAYELLTLWAVLLSCASSHAVTHYCCGDPCPKEESSSHNAVATLFMMYLSSFVRAWHTCLPALSMGLRAACVALAMQGAAWAIPPMATASELASLSANGQHVSIDARKHWQSALVGVSQLRPSQASDPELYWTSPNAEFKTQATAERMRLTDGQRYVARLNMQSTGFGSSMHLVFKMPRLDAVHMAYRYDNEPWIKASAGDTIPMNAWAFSDRQPSFDIPLRPGNLNIVVEIAHIGVVDAPMQLQSSSTFRDERLTHGLSIGALVGINFVLALLGAAAAFSFGRANFLAVSVMTTLMAMAIGSVSGMSGVYMFTSSATFNDESKFWTLTAWCVVFPWVTAVALSLRQSSRWWWRASIIYAALGLVFGTLMMGYSQRSTILIWVPMIAIVSAAFSLTLLGLALLQRQRLAVPLVAAILVYAFALMVPLSAFLGYLLNEDATMIAAVATMFSALLFLQAMLGQYRHGRMVMSRAKISPARDVLTGLLSRKGFEQMLVRNVQRMKSERSYAAFYYIQVGDAQTLKERYGDEGFETGMVQMAAAISSTVSVVDSVGRVAPNAFAVIVLMPRDAAMANRLSQKILTRTMSLASHGAPLAQTGRIAVAWLPIFGTLLPDIERRALRALRKIEDGKRIVWVGGALAQADASQSAEGVTNPTTRPNNGQQADDELPSLPGMINRIELEMLGTESEQMTDEAERLMRELQQRPITRPGLLTPERSNKRPVTAAR
jgi:GGDEF domain-containing protein